MAIQIDVAQLSGLVVEAGLYGVYLTLFSVSAYIFATRRRQKIATLSLPMIITAVCMLFLATAQIVVDAANIFIAFLNKNREERIAFLADTGTQWFAAKHCITISQLLIGDSFVSYRCWIVWGRRGRVVVLPVLLSLGSAVCGSYAIWALKYRPFTTVKKQQSWVAAFITLSLCANAVATSLLAFRIWKVGRRSRALMGTSVSPFMPIVTILIESGALNAAYLLIFSITLFTGTEALEFMAEVATTMSGIVFTVVIIRVGLNAKRELDWTADHRTASIKFAAGNQLTTRTTAFIDTEVGTLGVIHKAEVNTRHSCQIGRGSGTDVETDLETSTGKLSTIICGPEEKI